MRATILVVEKDLQTRQSMVYMLEALHYRAVGYDSMSGALRALQGVLFDAMLISPASIAVGETNYGTEAKLLQPEIKIIMTSGSDPPELLSGPIDAFIQKPFSLKILEGALNLMLGKSFGRPMTFTGNDALPL